MNSCNDRCKLVHISGGQIGICAVTAASTHDQKHRGELKLGHPLFTESAHLADSVSKSQRPSEGVSVCLSHQMQFCSHALLGNLETWRLGHLENLKLGNPPPALFFSFWFLSKKFLDPHPPKKKSLKIKQLDPPKNWIKKN